MPLEPKIKNFWYVQEASRAENQKLSEASRVGNHKLQTTILSKIEK